MSEKTKKSMPNTQLPAWQERTVAEKILYVFAIALAVAILIGFIIDIITNFSTLPTAFYFGILGVSFIVDAIIYWKYQRRNAIIFIVCGALVLLYAICSIFLN